MYLTFPSAEINTFDCPFEPVGKQLHGTCHTQTLEREPYVPLAVKVQEPHVRTAFRVDAGLLDLYARREVRPTSY